MRINLYGGPCCAKSRTASKLYADLLTHKIDLVREYVKNWAYAGRTPTSYDQLLIFASQLHEEDILLRNGVSHIVTDSPLLMQLVYVCMHKPLMVEPLAELAMDFEKNHPSINILLDREGIPYDEVGRYQNFTEAKELDGKIENILIKYGIKYTKMKALEYDRILQFVESELNNAS